MDRIDKIKQILSRKGFSRDVTGPQFLEALRELPPRPSYGAPNHADDSRDYGVHFLTLSPIERERLGIKKGKINPPIETMKILPEIATKEMLLIRENMLGLADLPGLAKPLKSSKDISDAAITPVLRLRVQALVCRNDNGKLSDGSAGQTKEEAGKAIAGAISEANKIFASSGIELVFYPSADLEIKSESKLNQDFIIPSNVQSKLSKSPPLSQSEMDALAATYSTTAYRDQTGSKYKGKLVLLFAEGTTYWFDGDNKRWTVQSPSGGGFSWEDRQFVKLSAWIDPNNPQGYATFLSHEVGHYLHLWHPFYQICLTGEENQNQNLSNQEKVNILTKRVTDLLNGELDKGISAQNAVKILDADSSVVSDTPSDDSGELLHYMNLAKGDSQAGCGALGKVSLKLKNGSSISYSPDRSIVMSYFKGCTNFGQHFSLDQAKRMRNALINGNRRHIISVQLGDTSWPGDIVCGVWNPNSSAQYYCWGYKFEDFNAKYSEMYGKDMRLTSQQAYVRNGKNYWDGIWNPGKHNQFVIWGWTVDDFKKKQIEMTNGGMRLIHLESYLLPDGQVRINAIWNPGNQIQHWIQGWTRQDCADYIVKLYKNGHRLIHLNSWNLPDGGVRYDAIWNKSSQTQDFILGWTAEDFRKKYGEMWDKKFKLLLLDAHNDGGLRYNAVWIPDAGPQFVAWGMTREQIRQYYDEMWQQGLKLRSMNSTRS